MNRSEDLVLPNELFAAPRRIESPGECLFYHTLDIPGHGTIPGFWDIRGNEAQYLGNVLFKGKRVLEVGPASGQLSFFMERQGAEVVSVEAADESDWELYWDVYDEVPDDLLYEEAVARDGLERIKNSYWFGHRVFNSNARVHYGNAAALPSELGTFDASVIACALLHNKHPLRILESCARVTRETMIIVEPVREYQTSQTPIEFLQTGENRWWETWWGFSPKYFVSLLRTMGFPYSRVSFHTQIGFGEPNDLFTVVASRTELAAIPPHAPINAVLRCPVERLRLRASEMTHLPVKIKNVSTVPLSSFSSRPVHVGYHWRRNSGEMDTWDGIRTSLPRTLYDGDEESLLIFVRAPSSAGEYVLEITLVEEGTAWYDDKIEGLPLRIQTSVSGSKV
jgi:SAM-dependent methyltransferase